MPPRGHYLAREAGWLAGVSGNKIGQWARRGYIRASQSSGTPKVYSYQDVAEAMVVHELVLHEVSLPAIRRALTYLRTEHGRNWPLTSANIQIPASRVPGRKRTTVFIREDGRDHNTRDETDSLPEIDVQAIRTDLSRGGWAAREIPSLTHIEVDPNRLSGRPTIRGKRMAAEDVARLAGEPGGRKTLRQDYDISAEEIDDAVQWWNAVQGYEEVAS